MTRQNLISVLAALFVGCAHAPPARAPATQETQTNQATSTAKKPIFTAQPAEKPSDDEQQGQADLERALAALRDVDLFFGFNDDTLTEQARSKLSTVADVLTKHPTLKITIDGNCDERGTGEYNIALGQRRADVAKKYLVDMGVKDAQIATVSYGAEKPRATGHDEKAWQENRRDDVVATPPQ